MSRRALLLSVFLIFDSTFLFAGLEPAAVAGYQGEDVAFLDPRLGIFRVSGGKPQNLVSGFGIFQPADLASDGDSVYVTLLLRVKSNAAFSRVQRWSRAGKQTGEWVGGTGGVVASVALDPAKQRGYCSDSRTGDIYQFDLKNSKGELKSILRIRDVGSIGPLAFDATKRRLFVADVQKGRIYVVTPDDRKSSVLLDSGTIIKPLALAFDAASGRLYVADAAKRRVWVVNLYAAKLAWTKFGDQSFKDPAGVAVVRSGSSVTIWVADRSAHALLQFNTDGKKIGSVSL